MGCGSVDGAYRDEKVSRSCAPEPRDAADDGHRHGVYVIAMVSCRAASDPAARTGRVIRIHGTEVTTG